MTVKRRSGSYLIGGGSGSVRKKTVTIKPGAAKAIKLGIFKSSVPGPEFEVSYSPDLQDDIGVSKEKLDIPGEPSYMLLYQFHNFSQKSCKVTMQRRPKPMH